MTIWGDRESWEEKARRKRKRERESEKRIGRRGEGNRPARLHNCSVTSQRILVLAGVDETLNGLQRVGIILFVVGVFLFLFVTIFFGLVLLLVGLVIVLVGGRRHSVAPPVQPTPQTQNHTVIIQKEVVRIKCRYCGALNDQGLLKCQSCGASLS